MSGPSISAQINEWNALLKEFIPPPKTAKGFLQIAGRGNLENVTSNLLAFFLNPQEDHGLRSVVLESLLELVCPGIDTQECRPGDVEVKREQRCEPTGHQPCLPTDKKLDILVWLKQHVIGIENKVDAPVYNDLKEYGVFLDEISKPNRFPVKVLLTLRRVKQMPADSGGFQHVRYSALFKGIRSRLKGVDGPSKYLMLLNDFMTTLERRGRGFQADEQFLAFARKNEEQLTRFYQHLSRFGDQLQSGIEEVQSLLKMPNGFKLPSPYLGYEDDFEHESFYVSLDCHVEVQPGAKIALAVCFYSKGWSIYTYPCSKSREADDWCQKLTSGKYDYAEFEPAESPETVAKKYQELLDKAASEIKRRNGRRAR
jgi:PD-(D/E)XK nuclease superfamily